MKIVFVCTGNICRSPMAEYYMKKKIVDLGLESKYIVKSMGISAYNGQKATENAIRVMEKYKVDMKVHKATYIEDSDIDDADLIICMTVSHKDKVLRKYPYIKHKTYTIKEYINDTGYADIDDPWGYGYDVYYKCAQEIVNCVDKLVDRLIEGE